MKSWSWSWKKKFAEEPPETMTDEWNKKATCNRAVIEHWSDLTLGFVTGTDTAHSTLNKLDSLYERQSFVTQLAIEKRLIIFTFEEDIP